MPQILFVCGLSGDEDVLIGLPDSWSLVDKAVKLPTGSLKYLGGKFMQLTGEILSGHDDNLPSPGKRGRMFVVTRGERHGTIFIDMGNEQVESNIWMLNELLKIDSTDGTTSEYELAHIDCGTFA